MSIPINLGFQGLELQAGEHLCGVYAGVRQRDEILLPFLRAGLEAGDKCICIVDGTEPAEIVAALGVPGGEGTSAGIKQLDVIRASDVYLRSGKFSAPETIATWKAAISEVMYLGRFARIRAVESWSLRDVVPDTGELLQLETEMTHFLALYPQVILCLYDIDRFGGEIISDVIKLHSKVFVRGMIVENPFYLAPNDVLASPQQFLGAGSVSDDGVAPRRLA
jgi:hypothetical protein